MYDVENNFDKYSLIACIDEVGRGCLAGDVVSCAIIMPKDHRIEGVKDSKKVSQKKREELYDKIISNSLAWGIGRVNSVTIDRINIKEATRLSMKMALYNLQDKDGKSLIPDIVLVDAESIDIPYKQVSLIKGDEKSYGIACASIVAKVYRDRMCIDWDIDYPGYHISKNKGYGTKDHIEAIRSLGMTKIHRRSFLKKILMNE